MEEGKITLKMCVKAIGNNNILCLLKIKCNNVCVRGRERDRQRERHTEKNTERKKHREREIEFKSHRKANPKTPKHPVPGMVNVL